MPSNFNAAAKLLNDRMHADGLQQAFDPSLLFDFLLAMIDKLVICRPSPNDAFADLTWKPSYRPFLDWWFDTNPAKRQAAWRKDFESRAGHAGLTPEGFKSAMAGVWASVDAGDLTPGLLAGMYSERRR